MDTLKLHLCEFAGNGDTYLHKQAPKILESSLLLARHSVRPVSTKPDGFGGPPNWKKLACLWSHRTGVRTTRNSRKIMVVNQGGYRGPHLVTITKPLDSSWRVGQMLSRWFCVLLPLSERLYFPITSVVLCFFDTYIICVCMYIYIYYKYITYMYHLFFLLWVKTCWTYLPSMFGRYTHGWSHRRIASVDIVDILHGSRMNIPWWWPLIKKNKHESPKWKIVVLIWFYILITQ